MATLILDPYRESEAKRLRTASGADERYDEVWDGVHFMSPAPNNEHHRIQSVLLRVIASVVDDASRGETTIGVKVSDREEGWTNNYRCPDLVVFLTGNPAVDRGTFWQGGPDFAVEIVSPGEDPHAKLVFYASVGTRELLVVHREPWALELFSLAGGTMGCVGRSDLARPAALVSAAVGLSFALVPGLTRPQVEISHGPTNRTWRA